MLSSADLVTLTKFLAEAKEHEAALEAKRIARLSVVEMVSFSCNSSDNPSKVNVTDLEGIRTNSNEKRSEPQYCIIYTEKKRINEKMMLPNEDISTANP